MSNSVIITTILIGILVGILAVGIQWLKYKRSIVFSIAAIIVVPIVIGCASGLIIGARGVVHFLWAGPLVVIVTTLGLEIIARMIKKPMNEMLKTVDSLSEGDVDASFDEKFQKGNNELSLVMRRLAKLTESLRNIAAFANHVGKGELNSEYTLLGEKDDLGMAMLDMRANLQQAETEKEIRHREDERRNWVTQGVAKFADLLRANNDNIEELCHSIVSNLVKYIGANQAGIFILNDDDAENPVLELKACYAYERRKYLQKTIKPGEGLVGTCFLERQSIYMTHLPKDYIHITSGLGDDTPRALLLVPLKVNGEVYGIIEIAAFTKFEPHVREFVEKVSESIASTIGSVKVNIRTSKLLEISKIQAEEMVNQEEELRQNMEEMQATQEEMRRRDSEIQTVLKKSQNSEKEFKEKSHWFESLLDACTHLLISVTDMDGKVTFLNQAALNKVGMSRKETIGKPCSDVWKIENCHTGKCGYKKLKEGVSVTDFKVGDQLFSSYASYIKDSEGNNIGHIEVIDNITQAMDKEYEMQQFRQAIFNTCNVIEISADGYITGINQNMLTAFHNTDKSFYTGKHISLFIGDEDCQTAWELFKNGKPFEKTIPAPTGDEQTALFKHVFIPILNKQGKLLRVLLLASVENE